MSKLTERVDFVRKVQGLLNETEEWKDIEIKYGYEECTQVDGYNGKDFIVHNERNNTYWKKEFIGCDMDINNDETKREMVIVKRKIQSEQFGVWQSIEMDSLNSILKDIMKIVSKL